MSWFEGWVQNVKKPFQETGKTTLLLPELEEWLLVQRHLRLKHTQLTEHIDTYLQQVRGKCSALTYSLELWTERQEDQPEEFFSQMTQARQLLQHLAQQEGSEVLQGTGPALQLLQNLKETFSSSGENNEISSWKKEVQELQALQEDIQKKKEQSGLNVFDKLQQTRLLLQQTQEKCRQTQSIFTQLQDRFQQTQVREQQKTRELQALQQHPDYQYFRSQLEPTSSTSPLRDPAERKSPFQIKLEEAHYKLIHFTQQRERLQEQIVEKQEELQRLEETRSRTVKFFEQLVKVSLGRDITLQF